MPSRSTCRAEIETLHEFFVDWYTGTIDSDAFDRLEGALAPGFEMVTPDGVRRDRTAVVTGIREDYNRDDSGTFSIEITNVELIWRMDDCATVRYEEWQETTAGTTGRLSTALFDSVEQSSTAQSTPRWRYVHETWLEE